MSSSNRKAVPEAKAALDQFKYEVANEIGVPLSKGYNGDLTSYQNGSVGGMMVKKMTTVRSVNYIRKDRNLTGHSRMITYEVWITA